MEEKKEAVVKAAVTGRESMNPGLKLVDYRLLSSQNK